MSRLSFVEVSSDRESEAEEEEVDIFGKRKGDGARNVVHVIDDEEGEEEVNIFDKESIDTSNIISRTPRRAAMDAGVNAGIQQSTSSNAEKRRVKK